MSDNTIKIFPSIMAADYANLGDDILKAVNSGADGLHLDIMDGHFVPNLTFGPDLIAALRPLSQIHFDAHLMVTDPLQYIDAFVEAGVDHISIHQEINGDLENILTTIKQNNCTAGIAINPDTSADDISDQVLSLVSRVVVMTVHPGFGGQSFIDQSTKVKTLIDRRKKHNLDFDIQLDGGINKQTAPTAISSGADVLVAGSAVFQGGDDYTKIIKSLRGA